MACLGLSKGPFYKLHELLMTLNDFTLHFFVVFTAKVHRAYIHFLWDFTTSLELSVLVHRTKLGYFTIG